MTSLSIFSCSNIETNSKTGGGEQIRENTTQVTSSLSEIVETNPVGIMHQKKTSTVRIPDKRISHVNKVEKIPDKKTPEVISSEKAAQLLFPVGGKNNNEIWKLKLKSCTGTDSEKIRCLLRKKYSKYPKALKLAIDFYNRFGNVAGVRPEQTVDGGWRGILKMIPRLPVGRKHRHLAGVLASFKEYEMFFKWLSEKGKKHPNFRITNISFKFYVTPGRKTPSASAWKWNIAYNLNGSLLKNMDGIRETLYHELFHLNDAVHNNWSERKLRVTYDSILAKCRKYRVRGNRQSRRYQKCLLPYAPYKTTVLKDNVFYAFHPESDAGEYAAELAVRYYLEHRAILKKLPEHKHKKTLGYSARGNFKCGPKENLLVWNLIRDEFFGGNDLTPPCK